MVIIKKKKKTATGGLGKVLKLGIRKLTGAVYRSRLRMKTRGN